MSLAIYTKTLCLSLINKSDDMLLKFDKRARKFGKTDNLSAEIQGEIAM